MRKKRVLIICANPDDGTSFYRGWGVFSKLDNIDLVYSNDVKWPTLSGIDIVFFQRPSHQTHVETIAKVKQFHVPIWCDWDDDGFNIEESNPAHEYFNIDERQAAMREILRLADVCSVSTEHLKEVFLKEVPTANIEVIPNAIDDTLFSLEPSTHERNKIIAMRGGSSHENDWGQYKDTILDLAKAHPDWTWAIMGYHPEWMNQIENIKIYEFEEIPSYFQKLMELRPAIAIVPLTDSYFNRSKSNIAFQEFTIAGACVVASSLYEFRKPGCSCFTHEEQLRVAIEELINHPSYQYDLYHTALSYLPRLSQVNELRKDIIERLERTKFHPCKKELPVFTEKQFHDYELAYGKTPEDERYKKLNEYTAKWIIDNINPKSALDLGCGVGGTLLELLHKGVNAVGIEMNSHSVQYFKDRYPVYRNQILQADITKEPIEVDAIGDVVYSIECFEHITMPESWWHNYLMDLSFKFRHFYFSSTPYHTIESFDKAWGHNNIRIMSRWKKLFEANGWRYVSNPRASTKWDLYFKSTNIKD